MGSKQQESKVRKCLALNLALGMLLAVAVSCLSKTSSAQSARGAIEGRVTADRGQVIAFRVAAHNLDRRLWYTVFTNRGHYTVPQALPGRYEVTVFEPAYDSTPQQVDLGAGDNKTADLAVTRRAESLVVGGNSVETPASSGK